MPVFAGSEDDARDEGAQRRAETHQRHKESYADHHHQCGGREKLAQIGGGDIAEERTDRINPERDDRAHRREARKGGQPDRHGRGQVDPAMMCRITRMGARRRQQLRHGEKGQQSEDRDHRDILHQQHAEARLAPFGAHQVLFGQGLDDNGGGGQREDHPDRQRRLPGPVVDQRDAGDGERGQQHLSAAQPEQLAAHCPQPLRFEFQPDDEQHHHHAEFGEDLQGLDIHPQRREQRTDRHACEEISEHRAEPEPARQRDGDHAGDEDQESENEETGHLAPTLSADVIRYAAPVHSSQARFHASIR